MIDFVYPGFASWTGTVRVIPACSEHEFYGWIALLGPPLGKKTFPENIAACECAYEAAR